MIPKLLLVQAPPGMCIKKTGEPVSDVGAIPVININDCDVVRDPWQGSTTQWNHCGQLLVMDSDDEEEDDDEDQEDEHDNRRHLLVGPRQSD